MLITGLNLKNGPEKSSNVPKQKKYVTNETKINIRGRTSNPYLPTNHAALSNDYIVTYLQEKLSFRRKGRRNQSMQEG